MSGDAEGRAFAERLIANQEQLSRDLDEIRADVRAIRTGLTAVATTCRRFAAESDADRGRWLRVANSLDDLLGGARA